MAPPAGYTLQTTVWLKIETVISTRATYVGVLSSMAAGFLREVIRAYHAGHADVAMHIREGASREQVALVRESRLDVAFVLGAPDLPNCEVTQLSTEHVFAALPQRHMLCDYDEITWESLRHQKVILCQSELGRAIHDRLITRLAQLGYSPCVERLDVGREALMHLVALGLGVSFTTARRWPLNFRRSCFAIAVMRPGYR